MRATERARPGRSPGAPPSARGLALAVLLRVETDGAYADRLLEARPAGLDPRDRALATELVYGTLRWQRLLDWHLGRAVRRPVAGLTAWVRALLRLSAYQLAFLDRVPAHAVVHEAVELAKRRRPRGASELVNGVLRTLAAWSLPWPVPGARAGADPVDALALRTSQPTWLVRRWAARGGLAGAEALARAMNERPPLTVRVNTLRATPETVAAALRQAGAAVRPGRFAPESLVLEGAGDPRGLAPLEDGWCTVQDEAAILVGHAVDPRPGELVADVCAAPGGKTTHLAQLMGDRGRVLATDLHPDRLRRVREACARLGATSVDVRPGGAAALAAATGPTCDRVLVDAPCSNTGVLRRNPDGKWRRDEADLARLAAAQAAILAAAAELVRPGGTLVYATCSLEPEENETVVAAFRAAHPAFEPEALPATVPEACRAEPAVLRTTPHRHGTDGFTAHRLRRRA
jgi:16S rRNA (cytosine967-C5)-methyltransferase